MKKFLFALGAMAMLISCEQKQEGFTINGTVTGFADGTMVYINSADENSDTGLTKIDSVAITEGKFTFAGKADEIDMKYLEFGQEQMYYLPFIYENGEITVVYDKDKTENTKVTGTEGNDSFMTFREQTKPVEEKIKRFEEENNEKMMQARMSGDETVMNELREEYMKIADELGEVSKNFVKNNKNFASLMMLSQLHQNKQITDEELIEIYNGMDDSLKATKVGKDIQELVNNAAKLAIGQPAPDFSAPTPEGTEESLKENLGKVTVIDFWAAWCGPCRKENPNVVRIYEKYKDQGLSIIGVSLDRDKDAWLKAIADDGLTWTQISNLAYFSDPIAKEYNINAIPATFILDADGNIAAKDLRGQELEDKIAELLAK
ncbi:TlpA disulfide reductase family protein [Avrilella dinanensis]|uniref:Thioredoxin domain-containing protein n=1 Tax=Avrilella dinanensis TaxID=2008672 RepID=A0A2M9R6R7_9FLAO|nr:TlpA disulfide reductase family protein [Avrilella dinanensis]PJR04571.1 hypothetical protein CDL10_08465 [Avrilella dinanensis]